MTRLDLPLIPQDVLKELLEHYGDLLAYEVICSYWLSTLMDQVEADHSRVLAVFEYVEQAVFARLALHGRELHTLPIYVTYAQVW